MSWQAEKDQLDARPPRWTGTYPAPLPSPDPGKPRRWPKGCGTDDGWHAHRGRGQQPCPDCAAAHAKALKAWAQARQARTYATEED